MADVLKDALGDAPVLTAELCRRRGLLEFVKRMWHLVEAVDLQVEPHIELICRHLEACAYFGAQSLKVDWSKQLWAKWVFDGPNAPGGIQDLVIAIPPGMTKSRLVSVFFPAWVWTWAPSAKFISTSYADNLAIDFGRLSFDLMSSALYRAAWPRVVIEGGERAAMSDYYNTEHGRRWSMPMGGKITGKHGHFLLSDDPIKPDDLKLGGDSAREALSKTHYRWDAILSNRSADASTFTRIIIAQRLHMDDLSGHSVAQGAHHLWLPMEYEPMNAYTSPWGSDWRTEPGELLSPKRFPARVIEERKRITPARDWSAQYQQRPTPEDGAVFDRAWFQNRWSGTPPATARLVLSIDSSLKEDKGDYAVLQVWWCKSAGEFWLLDQVRARLGFNNQLAAIQNLRLKWANIRTVLVEGKSNGTAIVDTLRQKMAGIIQVEPLGGKQARAEATTPYWQAGNVYLPERTPWVDTFVEEHVVFPVGSSDDQVDCASQFLLWATSRSRTSQRKAAVKGMRALLAYR